MKEIKGIVIESEDLNGNLKCVRELVRMQDLVVTTSGKILKSRYGNTHYFHNSLTCEGTGKITNKKKQYCQYCGGKLKAKGSS